LIKYKSFVEKQTNRQIKILRSDHGDEYMSNEFEDLCKKVGVKQELTITYTPQQNFIFS